MERQPETCARCGSANVRADVILAFDPHGAVVGVRMCEACYHADYPSPGCDGASHFGTPCSEQPAPAKNGLLLCDRHERDRRRSFPMGLSSRRSDAR
jgi:hypothetical protein